MNIQDEDIRKATSIFEKDADELIFVLRTHLFIEGILENIIKAKFSKHDVILGKNGFQFFDKLRLVKAMGFLPKGVFGSVMALTELRNKFAHDINYQTKIEDIKPIGELFKERYQKIESEHTMRAKINHHDGHITYKNVILILTVYNLLGYMMRLEKQYV